MAIETGTNTSYGGTTVTTKYSPLRNIKYKGADNEVYSALLTNRLNWLATARVLPQSLLLCTDWDPLLAAPAAGERRQDPPLVVISSNRSNWIAAGVEAGRKQFDKVRYSGSNDPKALTAVNRQTQSPPLYVPQRTEGNRKVFIVVHIYEYTQYRTALADTGMTVVGWSFKTPKTRRPLTGFGASRYAAIEFCKHLRANMLGDKWDYAWLLDDNVVGITDFPGYAPVEKAIAAGTTPTTQRICVGFQGASSVESQSSIKEWANKAVLRTELPAPTAPTIIQQVALWNISYLTEKKLNFSPLFVLSGEDVSLGNYINSKGISYLYYASLRVRKEIVGYHDYNPEATVNPFGAGAKKVSNAREHYAQWFAEEEAKRPVPPGTPPPPVQVESADYGAKTLAEFITAWFNDPDARKRPGAVNTASETVRNNARCQAVEQIACGALGAEFVSDDAMNRTFKMHGEGSQDVQRHRPPPPPVTR